MRVLKAKHLLINLENSMAVVPQSKKAEFVFHLSHLAMFGYQIQISVSNMSRSDFALNQMNFVS